MRLHDKVKNPLFAGSIVVVLAWLAKVYGHQEMPPEVASAITVIVMTVTGYNSDGSADAPFIQPPHPPPLDHK